MFGESERCIMHKNTTDLKIQENLLTNKDLDRLISRGLDVHNPTAKKEQNMSTWEESARKALEYVYQFHITESQLSDLRIVLDKTIDAYYIYNGGEKKDSDVCVYSSFLDQRTRNVIDCWAAMGAIAFNINPEKQSLDFEKVLEVLIRKQRDYGHENIRRFGRRGILVRMHDKVARLENLFGRGVQPRNESIADNLLDVIGYSAIGIMWESGTFLTNLSDSKPKPENILLQNIKPLPWGRLD